LRLGFADDEASPEQAAGRSVEDVMLEAGDTDVVAMPPPPSRRVVEAVDATAVGGSAIDAGGNFASSLCLSDKQASCTR